MAGPPVNLAITPDQKLAPVANALDWVKEGDSWKGVPDNKLYVIDLAASPPKHIATLEIGRPPSGMAIDHLRATEPTIRSAYAPSSAKRSNSSIRCR